LIACEYLEQLVGRGGADAGGAEFDVFLSYASGDKPVVQRIAERLRCEGLRPFLDSDLTAGERWQRELAAGLARSKTCALFVGSYPLSAWQLEELELALVWANQREGCRVFAVLLPGAEDPFDPQQLPPFLSTRTWVDLRGGTSSRPALQRLLNAIRGVAQGSGAPAGSLGDVVPYRGLATFEEEHAEFFFGRERDIQRLLEILKGSPLLCVVGPSGSGKSSLVRAGLVPRLRDGALPDVADCRGCVLRPGAHPLQALATQLAPLGPGSSMQATLKDLADDRRSLHLAVSLALGADSPGSRVLIVVDQLEEIFTLCSDEREREQFFANLLHAAFASGGQTVVVLTIRADFYARCADYPELAQRTARSLALVGSMDDDELRQAIEEPARRVGLFLESGLVQTILGDVGSDAGALPLLEHALLELWRRRLGGQLTLDGYVEAGRVEGALAQRAETVFSSFTEEQQQIARRTMLRLTEPGEGTEDTRRRATRSELAPTEGDDGFEVVLGRLVDARLLTTGRDETGLEVVDVSHEALIRGWPRLRTWIDTDRAGLLTHRRLTDAAREWDIVDREPAALYRGTRLAAAREWATDHADDLSELEREFLAASQATEQRRTRRLRVLTTGLAALTVIVAVLAVWALDQRSSAHNKGAAAQRESVRATSLALAASSVEPLRTRPDVSLALAFEAYRESPRPEAHAAVIQALLTARRAGLRGVLAAKDSLSLSDIAVSPDGQILATASADKTVRLWNFATRKQLRRLSGHTALVRAVAFSRDGKTLASASFDKTVRLWDVATGKQLRRLSGHTAELYAVAFSPDGKTIASGGEDSTARLWDRSTGQQLARLSGHSDEVWDVAFSPDGKTLASSGDHTVRLWDLSTRKPLARLNGHTGWVMAVAFSPSGKTLASAGADKTVRLWDRATGRQLGRFSGHTSLVYAVAFSRDGKTLASAGSDETVRLWNLAKRKQLARFSGHTSAVNDVAFSRDGKTLASASDDRTIRLWDPATRKQQGRLSGHTDTVFAVTFSRDGKILASASDDETVWLWDRATGRQLGRFSGHTVALSPDGKTVASASDDNTVRLWDRVTGKPRGRLSGHTDTDFVFGVAISPDAKTLASAGLDETVRLWDLATRKQQGRLRGHTELIFAVAFSPDGKTLASSSFDRTVRLWDRATGRQLGRFSGHTGPVYGVAFSPDGKTLASASDDKTVRLWNPTTGKQLARLNGHTQPVKGVAFSPDGKTLASASDDKTVRLWNPTTAQQLGRLSGHTGKVWGVAFSPDGKTLASASDDKTVRLWNQILWRGTVELQATVCDILLTSLSRPEWAQYAPGIPYHRSCP
jgi:WD40 repeat protein